MCAINGYLQFKKIKNRPQICSLVAGMNQVVYHRGPDEEGYYADEHAGLGVRRLKIIDLESGSQPIFNEDRSLAIIMNGEIYNYRTLRKILKNKGHCFRTAGDAEVLLHAFEEYGFDCFNKVKGMFAAAIYNKKEKKLLLARDKAGEKPLYYCRGKDCLLFASELKSLLTSGLVERSIDRKALCQYFHLTYIPAPATIFEDAKKLEAGHYMEIDSRGKVECRQYWDLEYSGENLIIDYTACKKILRETLFNAVEENMVADVPVGAFLSGGIDSSIIVGIMSSVSTRPISTFTITNQDRHYHGYDDGSSARAVSALHKTNHHEYPMKFDAIFEHIPKIMDGLDEPFGDSSVISAYTLSQHASGYVKTVLTGDGGDELFAGYSKYLIGHYAGLYGKIPRPIRAGIIEKLVYAMPDTGNVTRKAKKVISNFGMSALQQRKNLMCVGFKTWELPGLLNPEYYDPTALDFIDGVYWKSQDPVEELSRALYTDFKVVLEGEMFPKTDRMGMMNSLEARTPLVYSDVAELAARIPGRYKIKGSRVKVILKDTFSDLLPRVVIRGKKKGFGVPVGKWLQKELKEDLMQQMDRDFICEQGIFNHDFISKLAGEHFSNTHNRFNELWSLFVFQNWYRRFFGND